MKILNFLRNIKNKNNSYNPLVKIYLDKQKLLNNLREYQKKFPNLNIAPVLKSNAYGHGLIPIANILDKEKIAFLIVDSLPEAKTLRNNQLKSKILIMGYLSPENIIKTRLKNIIYTITNLSQLHNLSEKINTKIDINLKIDTGMHRQGILDTELTDAIKIIKNNKLFNLISICSHLADADNSDEQFTLYQIKIWEKIITHFKKEFNSIKYIHIGATAGINLSSRSLDNVARIGLGLYGIDSNNKNDLNLKPILEMRSVISSIKIIDAEEFVGYNLNYQAKESTKIATVPVGYFEGVDRRLTNIGYFRVNNTDCQIIGNISMNITSINISEVPNLKFENEVIIISSDEKDRNSVQNIAELSQTIPYEILVHISKDLRRIII